MEIYRTCNGKPLTKIPNITAAAATTRIVMEISFPRIVREIRPFFRSLSLSFGYQLLLLVSGS